MKTGYPRPQIEYGNKVYPQPFTSEDDSLVSVNEMRGRQCVSESLCGVCGLKCEGLSLVAVTNKRYYYDDGSHFEGFFSLTVESGPFHIKCGHLLATLCPHIAATESEMNSDMSYYLASIDLDETSVFRALDSS